MSSGDAVVKVVVFPLGSMSYRVEEYYRVSPKDVTEF